jgi:K+-transporting ATPase ATPase C chain
MLRELRSAVLSLLVFSVITGVFYPLAVTAIAQLVFPSQANGSLIHDGDKLMGSSLIGQPFDDPRFFWGRLSATSPMAYNAASSGGSNLGPLNPALLDNVKARIKALRDADPGHDKPVPGDLVTSSASGLDPHISPDAAEFQVHRVAAARKLDENTVRALVAAATEPRTLGFIGEPRINVLELNIKLDRIK